jgi:hypothetical protein
VLLVDGRRIGLEHRELVEQNLAERWWIIESVFPNALERALETLGYRQNLSVNIGLDACAPLLREPSHVREMASRIAGLIHSRHTSLVLDTPITIHGPELKQCGFPDLLHVTTTHSRGSLPQCGPIVSVSPSYSFSSNLTVTEAIRRKEPKIPSYKAARSLDEVWLILVTGDGWDQAATPLGVTKSPLYSQFDAVYILDLRNDEVLRLDTPK